MKIMIVDDNYSMRTMLKNLLAPVTEEIFECSDGDHVNEQYAIHSPDWVLMDIKMKNMNGLKATSELLKVFPAAKVLIVTNYADDDFKAAAQNCGASGFYSKEDLRLVINRIKQV